MELFSAIKKNATTPGGGGQSNLMFSFFLFCWTGEMAPVGCGVDRGSRNFFPLSSSAAAAAAAAAASFTYNRVGWILLCIKKPSSAASRVLRPLLLWVKGTPDCFLSDRSGRAGSPELLSSELSVRQIRGRAKSISTLGNRSGRSLVTTLDPPGRARLPKSTGIFPRRSKIESNFKLLPPPPPPTRRPCPSLGCISLKK